MTLKSDVEAQSDQNLACRWPNHAWPQRPSSWYPVGRVSVFVWDCPCGAVARDFLNPDGSIAKQRQIDYSGTDHYGVRGYGRLTKQPFRRERMARIKQQFAPTPPNGSIDAPAQPVRVRSESRRSSK